MQSTQLIPFLMMLIPGLVAAIITAANAKKLNARMRRRVRQQAEGAGGE